MKRDISTARRIWILTVALEVSVFVAVGFLWLWLALETIHVWWIVLPVIAVHAYMSRIRRRACVCPNCEAMLVGFDGDTVFAAGCEECGAEFI
jgi:hypothetical protein